MWWAWRARSKIRQDHDTGSSSRPQSQQLWHAPLHIMASVSKSRFFRTVPTQNLATPDPGLLCGLPSRSLRVRSRQYCSQSTISSHAELYDGSSDETDRSCPPNHLTSESGNTEGSRSYNEKKSCKKVRQVTIEDLRTKFETGSVACMLKKRMPVASRMANHKRHISSDFHLGLSSQEKQFSPSKSEDGVYDISDVDEMAHKNARNNCLGREAPAYQSWTMDEPWVYSIENEPISEVQALDGIPVFFKPSEWLPQPNEVSARHLCPDAQPFLSQGVVEGKIPKLQHDPTWNRLLVTPHSKPFADLRQLKCHPDYLPSQKLLQYQAMEIAGWPVWRHDRNTIRCCQPACQTNTRDHDISTQLCLGCGPCSGIRYCSESHMLADIKGHWKECGHIETLLPYFIDEGTRPARFNRRYPFITDVRGLSSFEKHRQRHSYIRNKGQYTIFVSESSSFTVTWPTAKLKETYGPRVERLMNAAFLDQTNENVVGYLFYYVRMSLRLSNKLDKTVAEALRSQFSSEFGWNTDGAFEEDQCECTWLGDEADDRLCSTICNHAQISAGGIRKGPGIKKLLEQLEASNFLLRIWQRQHPHIRDWRLRLIGKGFPGAIIRDLTKQRPLFGKGWNGIGSPNIIGAWESI